MNTAVKHWRVCRECSNADVTVAGYGTHCWCCEMPIPTGSPYVPWTALPYAHGIAARELL
jgi:hypothetical protein